ncbi:MAG: diguanylate cyclase [Glaciihabitans sp.]|nr:diguanylate cyclase [Glaciihabitans sp.]
MQCDGGPGLIRQWVRRCVGLASRRLVPLGQDLSNGPRPPARTVVHASGATPQRILLLGGGPAVGYGVGTHDLALGGQLTRAIAAATGRGADTEVFARANLSAAGTLPLVTSISPERFDAVVLTIGLQDALAFASTDQWLSEMQSVLTAILSRAKSRTVIFLVAVPPVSHLVALPRISATLLDRSAARLNRALVSLSASNDAVFFVPFTAPSAQDGLHHHGQSTYRLWAQELAETIGPVMLGRIGRGRPALDEHARQSALDRLNILDTEPEDRFDRITTLAQRYFGAAAAAITLVDRDRQWFKSSRGIAVTETSRSVAMCDYTIRGSQSFVVSDLLEDPRFANAYKVNSGQNFRAYAGFPLESPEGHRIGALCVFDTKPRIFTAEDIVFLRELAYLAQEQLWLGAPAPGEVVRGEVTQRPTVRAS